MTFLKLEYSIPIFIVLTLFLVAVIAENKRKFSFVEKTFFKRPNFKNKTRSLFLYTAIVLLGVSLLDPRGPQEKLETNIPDQKTIIVIDSSASMLAEDVRPNRYKKSLLMARHFIKKAFGHKIAVVLFSDTQKRLVPFTDDLDLLDARVAGLEKLDLYDGGSNISQAIKESLGYFRLEQGEGKEVSGNLLVFTDSEGHDDGFTLKLPESVSLAIVGVGTARGARIPNRDKYGIFRGYKKFQGKEVVTKLNESWLKELEDKVSTYAFWIANSYTIPTEDIMKFFNSNFENRLAKGRVTVRPVKVDFFLVPAIILLVLSFLLYLPKSFSRVLVWVLVPSFIFTEVPRAQDTIEELQKLIKEEDVSLDAKRRLAELYAKKKEFELAQILYEEIGVQHLEPRDINNYALTFIASKEPTRALEILGELQRDIRANVRQLEKKEQETVRQNVLLALNQQKQKGKNQDKKDKKNSEEKKKQNGEGEKDKSGENQDQGKDSKSGSSKDQRKDESKDKEKSKEKGKEQSSDRDPKGDKKKSKVEPKSLKETQEEIKKQRRMVKVPSIIKQIMSDDRNLQQKYLDTTTKETSGGQNKDW